MYLVTAPSAHAWAILAALVVLALITAIEPRTVPRGQWLVVLRSGRVHRVRKAGFTARLPLLEQYIWLPRAYTRRPFAVSARSRDGLDVRIDGEIRIRIVEPAVAVAAVARGACIVEKHFTLDRSLGGPDASWVDRAVGGNIVDLATCHPISLS